MTEKELQKLFRKKFAEREVPYNPDAWAGVEKMLDRAATPWYARKSFLVKGVAATLATAAVVVTIFSWPSSNQPTIAPNTAPVVSPETEQTSVTEPTASEQESNAAASFEPSSGANDVKGAETLDSKPVSEPVADGSSFTSASPSDNSTSGVSQENTNNSTQQAGSVDATSAAMASSTNNNAAPSTTNARKDIPFASMDGQSRKAYSPLTLEKRNARESGGDILIQDNPSSRFLIMCLPKSQGEEYIEPAVGPKRNWLSSSWQYGLLGMLGSGEQWSNTNQSSSTVLSSWSLGGQMRWNFSENWSIESALLYSRRNDLQLERKIEGVTYGFGADRQRVNVEASAADMIEMPLMLGNTIAKGHLLKAGYYFAYFANVKNEVVEESMGMYDDSWSRNTRTANGYEEGFYQFDHGWYFGYEWQAYDRLSFGVDYQLGLQDLSRDVVYLDERKHYNRQLRFRLSYYLQ